MLRGAGARFVAADFASFVRHRDIVYELRKIIYHFLRLLSRVIGKYFGFV